MTRKTIFSLCFCLVLTTALVAADKKSDRQKLGSSDPGAHLQREVRHELVMLPYYTVFDDLSFQVQGSHVILMGAVTRPVLKSDAESVVKKLEGVETVTNNIKVLPALASDDQIRRAAFREIYSFPSLSKYGWGAVQSIHIIVDAGHITLTGVVDNEADKNAAEIRAKGVPLVFSVTNNLQVVKQG